MKRRFFAMTMLLLLVMTMFAQAAPMRAASATPRLSFSGTTANCSASCKGDSVNDKVSATLTLYQGSSYVDSWSESGTNRVYVSGQCSVQSGKSYRLVVEYTVNGKAQSSASFTATCP